eukprot:TRINITY_DN5837_c5_g1_i1.p1 TRINITY_DN5837_c5_g1~~TRINITY_DN5837_c5_g1_i1.p1  ORF type:complete len:218 (+),score=44.73 TRINITY_DN5837_c5_g1_i1:56-655(+)
MGFDFRIRVSEVEGDLGNDMCTAVRCEGVTKYTSEFEDDCYTDWIDFSPDVEGQFKVKVSIGSKEDGVSRGSANLRFEGEIVDGCRWVTLKPPSAFKDSSDFTEKRVKLVWEFHRSDPIAGGILAAAAFVGLMVFATFITNNISIALLGLVLTCYVGFLSLPPKSKDASRPRIKRSKSRVTTHKLSESGSSSGSSRKLR